MSEEIQKETSKIAKKRLYAEGRGRYTMLDSPRAFNFDFPIDSSIEDNFAAISFIKEEIFKAIEIKAAEEKKAKETEAYEPVAEKTTEAPKPETLEPTVAT